jgi:FMN-dependent NADH-azoreductase
MHAGTSSDTQTAFIRTFLGFLGLTDRQFVYAEGLGIRDDQRTRALAQAHATIDDLAGVEAIAA